MKNTKQKVIICEDHQIVVDGLSSIITGFSEFEVIATTADPLELENLISKGQPNILLLDLNLPGKNGFEILKDLRVKDSCLKVLILTMYNKKSIVQRAVKEGANGFLLKNCSSNDLYYALEHVTHEKGFYHGEGVVTDNHAINLNGDGFYKSIHLTKREKEIITYLCDGKKVPEIASKMHISPLTVETHKKNIYKKLGVDSSTKLVTFAHENKII
ncbi:MULTISPECIES: response regulator [Flavobacteriaceae]|uniref:response regulator n=1 Tax=Flavobacteriaceae TaxID=49546 RepID=UPI001491DFED|nr:MULTISPECIES: response regulator transcription factor [Allomuricauda]MDC6365193.1 response regulator transcription factor [Muricauda sp. AC10]